MQQGPAAAQGSAMGAGNKAAQVAALLGGWLRVQPLCSALPGREGEQQYLPSTQVCCGITDCWCGLVNAVMKWIFFARVVSRGPKHRRSSSISPSPCVQLAHF